VTPFLLAFPAALGYAILQRYRISTDQLIKQSTIYTLLGFMVILGYVLITTGASMIAGHTVGADTPMLVALLVTITAFVVLPLRRRLERMVDRAFFRARRDYQGHLEDFGHRLTQSVDLAEVVETIRITLEQGLNPGYIYVFMLDPDTNQYVADNGPNTTSDIRFDVSGGVAQTLIGRDLIYLSPDTPLPPELIDDAARLQVLKVVLMAALKGRRREELNGFIALSAKRAGESYVYEDLRFVEAIVEQASLAVERAQVISDLERRIGDLDALTKVAQAVNFTIEFDDLLELVYAQASRVIDTGNFFIALYDPKADEMYYAFYLENDERVPDREDHRWRLGRGLLSEVVRLGQPIRTNDYMTECAKRDIRPMEHGLHAWMGVPLNAGASTLGAMAVASTIPGVVYTDEQLKVLWAIADAGATAIDKSRLFSETERRAHQLTVLNQISTQLAQVLDVEELLHQIVEAAVNILQCQSGSLLLSDVETGDLEFRVATGQAGHNLIGSRLPRGTGVAGTVAERGEPIIVNDVRHDPRWFAGVDQDTAFETEAVMAVPLIAQAEVIGVIEVLNKSDGSIFTDEDEQLLTTFAGQAAIAIDNTRLFQQTDAELSKRVEELQMLSRIDRELNTSLDIQRIINLTLDWAMRVSGANAGAIGSVEPGTGIRIMSSFGYPADAEKTFKKPLSVELGIAGRVIRTGEPELVSRVGLDPDYIPLNPDTRAQIVVPLRAGGEVVGVIMLDSFGNNAFTDHDLEFVVRIAEHASPAIINARLFERLRVANEAKSEFVGTVSHELKNPMTAIQGFTEMMMKGGVGEISQAQMRFLQTIRSNVERMCALVDDLEDSTAIETGKIKINLVRVSLPDVVEEILRNTQSMVENKGQRVHVNIAKGMPDVTADRMRLSQILTNLVSNANKYTQEGGIITISANVDSYANDGDGTASMAHISVKDNGIGMSQEDQERLFEKFFRSTNPVALEIQGTGLGLNITKNLVELQGGSIWLESALGEGSTFHFTMPLAE
jgi:signal transduction histidine kinase